MSAETIGVLSERCQDKIEQLLPRRLVWPVEIKPTCSSKVVGCGEIHFCGSDPS